MSTTLIATIIAIVAVVAAAIWAFFLVRTRIEALNQQILSKTAEAAAKDAEVKVLEAKLEGQKQNQELLEKAHAAALEAVKTEMTAQTEKILKQRQEELDKKAEETFKAISGTIGKDLKDMKEAFDGNRKVQTESSASLKTQLDEAVKHLREQAGTIGAKADHLADALRGRKKMQGCWGETILSNLFAQEGLIEGRDFDREATLRDEMGIVTLNEDTGKRMRPDFILHYPDNTDIIVDSKVSLNALADWFEAEGEAEREDALKRNLEAVRGHIKELSDKRYADYLPAGRRSLGYVVMFVPNYGALQLAKQLAPDIVGEAFKQNVLITTEETIMPFLRMIHTAWVSTEQVRNQEKIVKAAAQMVERVADFCKANAAVGKKLEEALDSYEQGCKKLQEGGQSITRAAREVMRLGVQIDPKKEALLPPEE